jgi:thiol-disulfide isomerase/thioredoxin
MSRRMLLAIVAGVAVLAAGAFLVLRPSGPAVTGDWPPGTEIVPVAERRPLPAFAGEDVRAGAPAVDLASLRGAPVVLNFWASWCGPCRAEQRALERASRQLAPSGVRFVGVNIRDDRAAAAAYLGEFEVSYPSIYDRPGVLASALGRDAPPAPPTTLIIDAEGRVAARMLGVLPGGGDTAVQAAELERVITGATGVVAAPTPGPKAAG